MSDHFIYSSLLSVNEVRHSLGAAKPKYEYIYTVYIYYIYIRTYSTSIPPSRRAKVNTPSPPVEISNGTPPPLYMALAKVSTALAEPTLETPPYPGGEWGGGMHQEVSTIGI